MPVTKKTPKFATLTSWSYSVYVQYIKCPLSVCFDKVQRVRMVEPPNPAFDKGNRVHDAADEIIKSPAGKKPPTVIKELSHPRIKGLLVKFRAARALVQQEWAFDRQWRATSWRDWQNTWLRIKTDVCAHTEKPPTVDIVDWKTGKVSDDHAQQRSLYALGGLQLVKLGVLAGGSKDTVLTASHEYTDTGQSATEVFKYAQLDKLKREWTTRTREMMADTTFQARPGYHCRWCKFRKSNGGPCPENQ